MITQLKFVGIPTTDQDRALEFYTEKLGFEVSTAALEALPQGRVQRRLAAIKELTFALVFVEKKSDLDQLSAAVVQRAAGDAILWFAYPKGTSKKFACDFNRDSGWDALQAAGFDAVRQVAIDEDWSALRFRRNEFNNQRSR